jgi:hypothetical protein
MSLQGFRCPKSLGEFGGKVSFDFCQHDCQDPCHPLPLLASLLESREVVPGVYSVTEILKPYQLIYLARHNDWWATPESLIWMIAGSAAHSIIEEGGKLLDDQENHEVEVYDEVDLGIAKLRGTYDYWDAPRKTIWDWKNAKVFPVKKMKEAEKAKSWLGHDYFTQLNIYRAFFQPEAERLRREVLVQGWDNRVAAKDGLKKIETIEVPLAPIEEVRGWVMLRLNSIVSHENGLAYPPCTAEETWGGNRCKEYCPVLAACRQGNGL